MLKLAVILVLLVSLQAQKEKDRVDSLPGYINFTKKFEMYSGLLPLKQDPLMNMHYIFVTSMSATKDTDPVVVWLNGGPGCSSLLGTPKSDCRIHPRDWSMSYATWRENLRYKPQ